MSCITPPVSCVGILAPCLIPEGHVSTSANTAATLHGETGHHLEDFPTRVGSELPARGLDRLFQDDELPLSLECPAQRDFFGAVKRLVEASSRVEGLAGRKEKTPCGK